MGVRAYYEQFKDDEDLFPFNSVRSCADSDLDDDDFDACDDSDIDDDGDDNPCGCDRGCNSCLGLSW